MQIFSVTFASEEKKLMIQNFNIQAWWWRSLTLVDNECGFARV